MRFILPLVALLLPGPALACAPGDVLPSGVFSTTVSCQTVADPRPVDPEPGPRVLLDAEDLQRIGPNSADGPWGLPIRVPASWGRPPADRPVIVLDGTTISWPEAPLPTADRRSRPADRVVAPHRRLPGS